MLTSGEKRRHKPQTLSQSQKIMVMHHCETIDERHYILCLNINFISKCALYILMGSTEVFTYNYTTFFDAISLYSFFPLLLNCQFFVLKDSAFASH